MNNKNLKFAINHCSCPHLSPKELINLAENLGIPAVELRNDIKENSVSEIETAETVGQYAAEKNIEILTINGLYPFNIWNKENQYQTEKLADLCQAAGAKALVCCPLVSNKMNFTEEEQVKKTLEALKKISPILKSRGLLGHLETLGFPTSTLRKKNLALRAIDEADVSDIFNLLHDNFHHATAYEREYYPKRTGLVHISSVIEESLSMEDLQDAHRFFVQEKDITSCLKQINELIKSGYDGYFSFEPFAKEIWRCPDPGTLIEASMNYIIENIDSL